MAWTGYYFLQNSNQEDIVKTEITTSGTWITSGTWEVIPDTSNKYTNTEDILNMIQKFHFNEDKDFLNCSYNSMNNCVQQTVQKKALEENNIDICAHSLNDEDVQQCRNNLWSQLALSQWSQDMCDNIENEFESTNCKSSVIKQQAIQKNDVSLCEDLEDVMVKQDCQNQVYLDQATTQKDEKICDNIQIQTIYLDNSIVATSTGTQIEPILIPQESNMLQSHCISMVKSLQRNRWWE